MAATAAATQSVGSVEFSFLTTEEVRRHSFVKVTNRYLLDPTTGIPLRGGLYDPSLGPYNDRETCQRCGQRYTNCPGHCGHIDLVLPVYNPLLFDVLSKILKVTCFSCHRFRTYPQQVEKFVSQMKLIARGDVIGAKKLDTMLPDELGPEESDVSHESFSSVLPKKQHEDGEKNGGWTSIQFSEIMSVLRNFFKIQSKKCKYCGKVNPAISKPIAGWFHMSAMRGIDIRANIISSHQRLAGALEGMSDAEDEADGSVRKKSTSKKHKEKNSSVHHEFARQTGVSARELLPSEVKDILEILWENEAPFCSFLTDIQQRSSGVKNAGASMFFLEAILVPPIKFRPPAKAGDSSKMMDHPQTTLLAQVLESNVALGNAVDNKEQSKIVGGWLKLQQSINVLFDGKTAKGSGQKDGSSGIIQLLEKKEGLFRQKMMGKRVNYACRSVISPDPYLGVNEIGIPPCFAVKLTYPERVTPWNVAKLRSAVINGSEVHPGATHYSEKSSVNKLPPNSKARISISRQLPSSRGATQPGKSSDHEYEGKIVYRHLRDGDVVLVNRQPTLHKPSIMAHVVRVLKGEKTIRMHYANCSTYNADFDGDEMNVHLPQDEISRSEAYNIVNANNQYARPSNGEPLRSLIQDHIVSATLLTKRNTFLTLEEYAQLLYVSGVSSTRLTSFSRRLGEKVILSCLEDEMKIYQPAIIKPTPLWTGKQVVTAILNHVLRGHPPFTVEKAGKISEDFFKTKISDTNPSDELKERDKWYTDVKTHEDKLLVRTNDLVRGVIDKAQFGEYGLVHTVQELFGSNTAGHLLSIFSRLFTAYLQTHGFTCGVDDLLIVKTMDIERDKVFEQCGEAGTMVHKRFIGVKDEKIQIGPAELQLNIEKIIRGDGESALNFLDRQMNNELNGITSSKTIGKLLTDGLLKPSGKNCISLMTASGAKGSKVNFQQISSLLGQQELEGKRVPRMVSGKTLPSFHPWDWEPRAGGYISDRFLTGLRPQEYYFHCMAGREGLVDTAVKTSRSGYLQRCLIKNMEGLKVSYDHTVRDADGSIIQFQYGEDGVDVHKTSFIANFDALAANRDIITEKRDGGAGAMNGFIRKLPPHLKEAAEQHMENFPLSKRISSNFVKHDDLLSLVKQKFFLSLAQPGEPVGVLAAQSVGEPSTQMTLNTFHLAGRGEMNVTLGIPRLQEILMTATSDIKTPIMTCPLIKGSKKEAANHLADKLKKITVADVTESMEVAVMPFAIRDGLTCRVYKLKMKLYRPSHYPKKAKIRIEKWEETLEVDFVRELEDAVQTHLVLLSKISGIKDFLSESPSGPSGEDNEDAPGNESARKVNDEDDDDNDIDDENDGADDLGLDAQKRKAQVTDEMNYDEDTRGEQTEQESGGEESTGSQSEIDDEEAVSDTDDMVENVTHRNPASSLSPKLKNKVDEVPPPVPNPRKKKKNLERRKRVVKKTDRAIFVQAKDLNFEIHFKFTHEPHILLAEIAKKAAKKVYIQNPGMIEQCRVIDCKESQVIYYGDDPKNRIDISSAEKENIPALHATGIDFNTFWRMQDQLDVRYIYSNSIHAMLKTYGVEAARETIMREVNHVFKSYGISVSTRHLSLIADFMTHSGEYRPMSRLGGIKESVSPFSKMSFETASKFIVEAALHGQIDNLENPSARICLGLPVKMGTGSFDLMQNFELH